MNIVLDTNVLVSSLWSQDGNCSIIMSKVLNHDFILVYNQEILQEYERVLKRPKFNFSKEEVYFIIDFIRQEGFSIVANSTSISFIDEEDRKFYEVAKTMNCILVTGNLKHFPLEKNIISPKMMVDIIRKNN